VYNPQDTIAALATPVGTGGIAVIRISGDQSFVFADALFRGSVRASDAASHTIHYGAIVNPQDDSIVDTVLLSIFRNPHSYTGEDVVEISVHGGYFVSQQILQLLYRCGARTAQPGEFTLRAFLNGKLDLTQAEAVADIINAKSERSHRASVEQLNGRLSKHIENLRKQLLDLCSLMELELDFSQEGIELTQNEESLRRIKQIGNSLQEMIDSYSTGKFTREGVKVALAGRPNVGKSSLLNVLLEEERAIVSEVPGTTRDTIEESIILNGLEFVFVDTAGLRESIDIIEKEGIRRTIDNLQKADLVLLIVDTSLPVSNEDIMLFSETIKSLPKHSVALYVLNKNDRRHTEFSIKKLPVLEHVDISCVTLSGIDHLKTALVKAALKDRDTSVGSLIITNLRHKNALESALKSLKNAEYSINNRMSGDFIAVDLRDSLNYLGEIIGLTTPDDILNNIFSQFCIGK
jgi:tRNA modification GTPase